MSLEVKGQSCPICKAYLFEDDEVAVCPTCGAPHHRECFVNLGRCGMEEFHGTDKQYDLLQKNIENRSSAQKQEAEPKAETEAVCRNCKKSYPASHSFCPDCGAPNEVNGPLFVKLDFLGGVKPDEDLGDGNKADEVKDFVAVSTNRFIPKFKEFKNGAKVSFSVWHLLFPSAAFAMRKMYTLAAVSGALEVAATLLMLPFNIVLGEIMNNTGISTYPALAQYMMENMDKAMLNNFVLSSIGIAIQLLVRILSALFAERLYYKHVIKTMSEIKKTAGDEEEKLLLFRKHGSVNLFAFTLVYMAIAWLPTIIYSFI